MKASIIIYFFSACCVLSLIIIGFSFILTEKNSYKNKVSAYECGFETINYPSYPFSIKFFVVGVIFLIFDLEIIYIIPWSYCSSILTLKCQLIIETFIVFIIIGLIYEWVKGGLEWI